MKELIIEQKAKAYDEVIEKLRNFYRDYDTVSCLIDVKEELANLFPILKESGDERIREAIIEHFANSHSSMYPYKGFTKKQILTWLEKQNGQKPADKVEPKPAWSEEDERERKRVVGLLEGWLSTFKETCYAEDCRCGIDWLKSLKERVQPQQEWSEEDEWKKNRIYSILRQAADTHAFSTSCRLIGDKECIELQDFLKSLKPQPKQEWSEEDDQYLLVCKNALAKYQASNKWDARIISCWLENKLKAPQNTWKPSDEQMKAVKEAVCYSSAFSEKTIENLISLSKQLKKLREE